MGLNSGWTWCSIPAKKQPNQLRIKRHPFELACSGTGKRQCVKKGELIHVLVNCVGVPDNFVCFPQKMAVRLCFVENRDPVRPRRLFST